MWSFHRLTGALLALSCLTLSAAAAADTYQDASQLYKDGNRTAALSRLNDHLADHPRDSRARFLKGVILTEENRAQEAIEVFAALAEDFPELPEPHNNLAVLYAARGEYERARQSLEMAIRTYPGYAIAHENLGDIYATLASQAYDKALQLDAGNASARRKLALVRELLSATSGTATAKTLQSAAAVPDAATPEPATTVAETPRSPADTAQGQAPRPRVAMPHPDAATAEAQTQAVLKTVEDWAKAWSSKDVERYLAFYSRDFRTPKGEARGKWEAERRQRLTKPRRIQVEVIAPKVSFPDSSHASVTFRQNYSADGRKSSSRKTLLLVREGERWLIQQEIVNK